MLGKKALRLKRDLKTIRKQMGKKKPRAKVMKVGRPPMPEAVYTKWAAEYHTIPLDILWPYGVRWRVARRMFVA